MDAAVLSLILAELLLAVAILVSLRLTLRRIEDMHRDVRTLTGQQTIGLLASEGETRRIEAIAEDQRSAVEQRHADIAALRDAPHLGVPDRDIE